MIALTWSQWTLVGCVIASCLLVLVGALRAKRAADVTKLRMTGVQSRVAAMNAAIASARVERINADIAKMPALVERAQVAIHIMNRSLAALKLPEAVAALRTAAAAVKLLASGR